MLYPVPVVRLIIPDSENRVLILRRSNTRYLPNHWCLPGGKIDYGETVEESVAKELREETSLETASAKYLFYQDSLPLAPGQMHCLNLYFECSVRGSIALNEESSEFAWIGPSELRKYQLAFRNDFALQRYWQKKGDEKSI